MKPALICLHGWGGSKASFTELRAALKDTDIDIHTPDLPGFGDEPEPKKAWSVNEYADWVESYIRKHAKDHPLYLLGHSHGGRIAITLAARQKLPIKHLYLCAAAGIRRPRHFKRIIGLTLAKSGKFFLRLGGLHDLAPLGKKLLYKMVRVHDYEKASPVMRDTLIRVTSQDLRPMLTEVTVPTDIFWGTADKMTPLKDSAVIHKQILHSRLHTYAGVRHAVHREKAKEIASVIAGHVRSH